MADATVVHEPTPESTTTTTTTTPVSRGFFSRKTTARVTNKPIGPASTMENDGTSKASIFESDSAAIEEMFRGQKPAAKFLEQLRKDMETLCRTLSKLHTRSQVGSVAKDERRGDEMSSRPSIHPSNSQKHDDTNSIGFFFFSLSCSLFICKAKLEFID